MHKGELLFGEGENSRAMYYVKSGMIRIFKKKGESEIEIDTVRAGQVFGELAFLDGNPRSASAEALTDCELNEISGPTFQEVLVKMPEWLKMLLKTVVGRLRTASTRIRQLETASSAFDYSEKDGKRASHYVYLSPPDVLKIFSAILIVASRNGKQSAGGIELRMGLVNRYAHQIMGVPEAKVTTIFDILGQAGIASVTAETTVLKDPLFLEQLIMYLNEENLLEPSKRHDITPRSFMIMSLMSKHLAQFPKDGDGMAKLNLALIKKVETQVTPEGAPVREVFRIEEFQELVKRGYCTNLNVKSNDEIYTNVKAEDFAMHYRFQRISIGISVINEAKRKGAK